VDPNRISIAGPSAGGNLALVTTRSAVDLGLKVRASLYLIPMMHYGATTQSYIEFENVGALPSRVMIFWWRCYAQKREDRKDWRCCPLEAGINLVGLPPCVVTTASCDVLRDEGLELVQALRMAGVPVTHFEVRGSHSFSHVVDRPSLVPVMARFMDLAGMGRGPAANSKL